MPKIRSKPKTEKNSALPERIEERIEENKYFTPPPAVHHETRPRQDFNFPRSYGENGIVLLVRDPHCIYSYWEITDDKFKEVAGILGSDFSRSRETLRVYDASNEPWSSHDIDVSGGARNWYINVLKPNRTYIVDIGFLSPDGRFIVMARSNPVTTPRDGPSDIIDEEWMTIDFERIYALSGGFGIGKSSGEIKKMMEKHLMLQRSSGWVTSISSPFGGPRERPFFLVANTELIVYGATEPTAKLYVQGKRVNLRRDGTFTLRFAFPDGEQVIPIEAVRDDEKEKRSITPVVKRHTK